MISDSTRELLMELATGKEYKPLTSFEEAARKFYREQFDNRNPSNEEIKLIVNLLHGTTCGCKKSHASNS